MLEHGAILGVVCQRDLCIRAGLFQRGGNIRLRKGRVLPVLTDAVLCLPRSSTKEAATPASVRGPCKREKDRPLASSMLNPHN